MKSWRKNLPDERLNERREYEKKYRMNERQKDRLKYLDNELRRKYGISASKFLETYERQERKCAICRVDLPVPYDKELSREKFWNADHDHRSGVFRGILCAKCNRGLGHFSDDPHLLEKAIQYLKNSS